MSTRPRKQIIRSNEDALAAFVSRKAEIDTMLARLQALSDDHFGYSPDEITWSHVGTLGALRRAAQAHHGQAFNEGEHADIAGPDLPHPPRAASGRRGSAS